MPSVRTALLALALSAGTIPSASAQTVLPPPPARPPLPEYVPPSQRPQRPAQAQPTQPAKSSFDPSTVEFTPIWTMGSDGSIQGPREHYELAAIRSNPLVTEDVWDFVEALLEERDREMELVAQAHPRQCIDAVTTVIPGFDIMDESTRSPLSDIAIALNQPGGLIGYLSEQGLLTPEMTQMSHYIAMDYTQNVMNGIKASQPEGTPDSTVTTLQSRFLVRQGLAEPLRGFGRLARRAIEADPSLVTNAGELLAIEGDAFIDAAAAALAPLSDEDLKRVLTEAYESAHGPVGG